MDCCVRPEEGGHCGLMVFRTYIVTVSSSVVPLWVKTPNRSAGIITQPVHLILCSKLPTLKPAADCDMDSPAEENMLSDSRPLLLSLLIYSCGLWAAVWNCGPADEKPGSWNIYPDNKQSQDGSEAEEENMEMKRNWEKMDPVFPGSITTLVVQLYTNSLHNKTCL